jgi:transposase
MDAVSEIADLRAKLAEREAELATAHFLIEQYKAQLHKLRRMKLGQSSEALDAQIHQLELRLEDLEESEGAAKATQNSNANRPRPERRQPVRRPLPEHLPREEIILLISIEI